MPFYRTDDLPVTEMLPGVYRRSVYLDDVMLTFFEFEPGAVIPEHHHPHQQITFVISGAMEFELDGEKQVLQAGDGAMIPRTRRTAPLSWARDAGRWTRGTRSGRTIANSPCETLPGEDPHALGRPWSAQSFGSEDCR